MNRLRAYSALLFIVALLLGGFFVYRFFLQRGVQKPVLERVEPFVLDARSFPDRQAVLTLYGKGFQQGATVYLYRFKVKSADVRSPEEIKATATIASLAAGWYDVMVKNPDGRFALLRSGIAVRDAKGEIPAAFFTIKRERGAFIFAAEGQTGQQVSGYTTTSPHWPHINVLDFGRLVKYFSAGANFDSALSWYASHADSKEVAMQTFIHFVNGLDTNAKTEITTLRQQNPSMKLFGYDLDRTLCQFIVCGWSGTPTTAYEGLPASYYLHFSQTTTIDYYDKFGNKGFMDLPDEQGAYNGIQDAGEPSLPQKTIPGCTVDDLRDAVKEKNCRITIFGYDGYMWVSNIGDADTNNAFGKSWQTWFADNLLAHVKNASYPLDGVFLDQQGDGFSIPTLWGFQTRVAPGQPSSAGTILEYGLKPKDQLYDPLNALDLAYNAHAEAWTSYLQNRMSAEGIFLLLNGAGYTTHPQFKQQMLNARGVTTEQLHYPFGMHDGGDEYQLLIDALYDLSQKGGARGDLYGALCDTLPANYSAGNFSDAEDRYRLWRLASYYILKEPAGSPGTMYFNPTVCLTKNDLSFSSQWETAYETDVGLLDAVAGNEKGYVLQQGSSASCPSRKYKIFARMYTNALIVLRPQDDRACTDYGDASGVPVSLGGYYHLLRGDGTLGAATNTITIRNSEGAVLMKNRAPVFNNPPDQIVLEGQTLTFDLTASDPDGDAVSFSGANMPQGATLLASGQNRATFSWTPSYAAAGSYRVDFLASDVSLSSSVSVTITVSNVNRAPTLTPIGSKTMTAGDTLIFTVSGSDPDGDPLAFSATNLPAGATFLNATFSWVTVKADAGTYSGVRFTVTDGAIAASEDIIVTVESSGDVPPPEENQPPLFGTLNSQTLQENTILNFPVTATDPDGDALTLSALDQPYGASFTDHRNGTGTFTWTPAYDQAGMYTVLFKASDGKAMVSQSITLTVTNVNRAPQLGTIGAKTVDEGTQLLFTIEATDPDGDLLTLTTQNLPEGATVTGRQFSWTPTTSQSGTYADIRFTVSDGTATDQKTASVTVNDVPLPPAAPPSDTPPAETPGTFAPDAPSSETPGPNPTDAGQIPPPAQETPQPVAAGGAFPDTKNFTAYNTNVRSGFTLAAGDVWGEYRDEIITGTEAGVAAHVRVFSNDGTLRGQFYAYPKNLKTGVRVAACDLDGNGRDEIVTAPARNMIPQIRIFDFAGRRVLAKQIWALDGKSKAGASLACGDLDGDGKAEIVVGAAAGSGQVTVHRASGSRIGLFFPFGKRFRDGITLSVADIDGDRNAEIVAGMEGNGSQMRVFTAAGKPRTFSFFPYGAGFRGGVMSAAGNLEGNGREEIIVVPRSGAQARVKIYGDAARRILGNFLAYASSFTNGARVAVGDVDGDGAAEIITIPGEKAAAYVRFFTSAGAKF